MKYVFACILALLTIFSAHAGEASIALASGETLAYTRYPGKDAELLLWFASERGLAPAEMQAAQELAAQGTEVWVFDFVTAFFLPQTNSSMDGLDPRDIQAIFAEARNSGKKLSVYAVNRAAVPVLKALAGRREQGAKVLLMHPHFYASVDTLVGAEYLAFGNLKGVDALILQPRRSAATPWAGDQLAALRGEGANAQLLFLEGLRERYWVRDTATEFEIAEGKRLAERIIEWRAKLK